jgi:uncharacterized protein (DUF924 family)
MSADTKTEVQRVLAWLKKHSSARWTGKDALRDLATRRRFEREGRRVDRALRRSMTKNGRNAAQTTIVRRSARST